MKLSVSLFAAVVLLPIAASAGTLMVTTGPTVNPSGAATANTLTATDPSSDQAVIAGGATITPPPSNKLTINMSGTYSANAGDLISVAYTFTADSNVTGNTTYTLSGSANPSAPTDAPGGEHFSDSGTIAPGQHVYTATLPPPVALGASSTGMFNLTLTFYFNAPPSGAPSSSAPAPSAATGTMDLTLQGIVLQASPTAAMAPPPGATPPPTPTPTPSPTPSAALLVNISTRVDVESGSNVLIGGFIVTGSNPKPVVIRGLGPSVQLSGASSGVLADPVLELHEPNGTVIGNDNWKENSAADQAVLTSHQLAPTNDLESALVATLDPGVYTTIVSGKNNSSGVGLVEVYDLDTTTDSQLANLSTRGFVQSGEDVMIGGFILGPDAGTASSVVIRALGPSLPTADVPDPLADPLLELHDANGTTLATNDNWQDGPDAQTISNDGLAPGNSLESALLLNSPPAVFTAVVSSANGGTGVALVEIYNLL